MRYSWMDGRMVERAGRTSANGPLQAASKCTFSGCYRLRFVSFMDFIRVREQTSQRCERIIIIASFSFHSITYIRTVWALDGGALNNNSNNNNTV